MIRTSPGRATHPILLVALCLFALGQAPAAVFEVRPDGTGPYPDIRSAVFAAVHGDTILLRDGLYHGPDNHNISFLGKSILVCSESNDPGLCVIDCGGGGSTSDEQGFIFESYEDAGAVLRGVTISRARAIWIYGREYGAGALIENGASPTIENCAFKDGQATFGGGIACIEGSPTIIDCLIVRNTAINSGGGLWVDMYATPVFQNCRILDNLSTDSGGGLFIDHHAAPIFRDCNFSRNLSDVGGAFFTWWATPNFTNCWFQENQGGTEGGVFETYQHSTTNLTDCTFVGNIGRHGAVGFARGLVTFSRCTMYGNDNWAGVLCTTEHGRMRVDHSIIAFSPAGCSAFCYGQDSISVSCSDFYGNPNGDWRWCTQDDYNGFTNVSVDPLFCAPEEGDFHVAPASWCAPGMNPGCGQVGAWPPGCGSSDVPVTVATLTPALKVAPNPAPGACRIEWTGATGRRGLAIAIYDVTGREVRTFRDVHPAAGQVAWNGRDDGGRALPSGIYLARASCGGSTATAHVVLRR